MFFEQIDPAKPTNDGSQVPILEIDGQVFTQSMALTRYACDLAGLEPEDRVERLKVHSLLACSHLLPGLLSLVFQLWLSHLDTLQAQKSTLSNPRGGVDA